MTSILTNTGAMVALQTMKGINANLNQTQAEISTGKSVGSAKDNAAYWRAKEGELARTILAMPQVRAARVHLASAPTRAFQPDVQASASVTLTTTTGQLSESQARAIRHLVASAVTGMRPDDVQIIDTVSGLIGGQDETEFAGTDAAARSAVIKGNVERLLAARVGAGKAVVEVAVELVSEREQITERTFDPTGRVAISSETEEKTGSSSEPGGDVTVASNLPEGDAAQGSGGQSQSAETRERVNYEVSETQREVVKNPGAIRRLTVAVMVDGEATIAADGSRTWAPRAEEELAALRELVASAVGLDEERGDVLTLKSLEFQAIAVEGTEAASRLFPPVGTLDVMTIIQTAVLALVAVVLGLFVVRPILTSASATLALSAPDAPLALPGAGYGGQALTGEVQSGFSSASLGAIPAYGDAVDPDAEPDNDPASRLRRLIEKRQTESIEILRGWMEHEEERA